MRLQKALLSTDVDVWSQMHHGIETESDSDSDAAELLVSNLSTNTAVGFLHEGTAAKEESEAMKNGKSKDRIKTIKTDWKCRRGQSCASAINVSTILQVCVMFWALAKKAQDTLLWTLAWSGRDHGQRFILLNACVHTDVCGPAPEYAARLHVHDIMCQSHV